MSERKKKMPWGLKGDGLKPGAKISESKMKAFNIGTMNLAKKGMSKREQEEHKRKLDQAQAAEIYDEFVASFEDVGKHGKSWVKGEVVNSDKKSTGKTFRKRQTEIVDSDYSDKGATKGKLYKPTSKLAELAATFSSSKQNNEETSPVRIERPEKPSSIAKKKRDEKKKSNLEIFKEELKSIQSERQERHALKKSIIQKVEPVRKTRFEPPEPILPPLSMRGPADDYKGSYPNFDDQTTTNIYLGNINPKMTEAQLCELFGKFGPLASVKVMWPRTDDERARGRNCGFVAFMNRKDGERAMNSIQGEDIMEFEMKLGWGKAVPIPPHPIYIPPALMELTLPPPPSGLPFNAQPESAPQKRPQGRNNKFAPPPGLDAEPNLELTIPSDPQEFSKMLANAVIKVVIPTERTLLCLIHRMVEFVVREGPMFEAMIMNRELNNPMFRFLFENQSPAHVYYRWKLFTILQGDSPYKWRTVEFQMFKNGSLWRPPVMNPYTQGMPQELITDDKTTTFEPPEEEEIVKLTEPKRGQLSESQRDRFEDMLRELMPEKTKVGDTMIWCLEHGESSEEIVDCITESLSILQTPIPKKIARLYLINDILYNCSAKVPHASSFRRYFEGKLPDIFKDIHELYQKIDARLKAEQFKQKVMNCFRAWEDWAVYPNDYLINLQNIFLGLVVSKDEKVEELDGAPLSDMDGTIISDIDGLPLDKVPEELDGQPIDDFDGAPLPAEDVDGLPFNGKPEPSMITQIKEDVVPKFKPSKWETVDENELENQAMTTSKWELLEHDDETKKEDEETEEDVDGAPMEDESEGSPNMSLTDTPGDSRRSREGSYTDYTPRREIAMTEERRAKLREIELKVMKYQDELEVGKRSRKPQLTLQEQIQHYRNKLLMKEEEKEREKEKEKMRQEERERVKEWERARDKERERERSGRERKRDEDTPRGARKKRSSSDSQSPVNKARNRSRSPPSAYKEETPDRRKQRSRSRSPKRRRRSRTPKRSRRSRSKSRSPSRSKHKHKKSKHYS